MIYTKRLSIFFVYMSVDRNLLFELIFLEIYLCFSIYFVTWRTGEVKKKYLLMINFTYFIVINVVDRLQYARSQSF